MRRSSGAGLPAGPSCAPAARHCRVVPVPQALLRRTVVANIPGALPPIRQRVWPFFLGSSRCSSPLTAAVADVDAGVPFGRIEIPCEGADPLVHVAGHPTQVLSTGRMAPQATVANVVGAEALVAG